MATAVREMDINLQWTEWVLDLQHTCGELSGQRGRTFECVLPASEEEVRTKDGEVSWIPENKDGDYRRCRFWWMTDILILVTLSLFKTTFCKGSTPTNPYEKIQSPGRSPNTHEFQIRTYPEITASSIPQPSWNREQYRALLINATSLTCNVLDASPWNISSVSMNLV
ncbi:hypothetical protein DL98DRAFT_538840 [Cadophora sp. DSE1049]|nr:hypothetical protein DL98DRAFT_538840 [Cadophora sp. DSE1049]